MTAAAWRDRHRAGRARRRIGAADAYVVLVLAAMGASGCSVFTRDNPLYCDTNEDCATQNPGKGLTCNTTKKKCEGNDTASGGSTGTGGRTGTGGAGGGAGSLGTGGRGGATGVDGGTDAPGGANGDGGGPDVPTGCLPACGSNTPICVNRACRACTLDAECGTTTPMTPLCGITPATMGKCVACKVDGDCTTPGNPACFDGSCVPCVDSKKHCTIATSPICHASNHTCTACTMNPECDTKDSAKPVCSGSACVECAVSGDCKTAGKPVCSSSVCVACTTDEQCRTKASATPACVIAAGAGLGTCVECTKHADCMMATRPICGGNNTCVPCSSDAECAAKSPDPGVCMLHTDRHCATGAEVLYVRPAPGCSDDAVTGMGLLTAPFCVPQRAISALTTTKNTIVIRAGTAPVSNWTYGGTGSLAVIGQGGATIGPAGGIGIAISSGDVYVRGLTVTGMTDVGISVSGAATVRLNRMTVIGNPGGLVVNGAGFEISNSVFSDNGAASSPVPFGGVYLSTAPGRPSVFRYNTVTGNQGPGLACAGAYPITGVLIANNMISQVVACTFSGTDSLVGPAGTIPLNFDTRPYRLTTSSPCYNKGGTAFPPDDIDGNLRPLGMSVDCGAHEIP